MRSFIKFLWLSLFLMLTACGGGSGDSKSSPVQSSVTLNSQTILVDSNESSKILSNRVLDNRDVEVILPSDSGLLSDLKQGKIFYLPGGLDNRFPLGLTGKVSSFSQLNDGNTAITLSFVNLSEFIEESRSNIDIPLTSENFVGVISPNMVQSAPTASTQAANRTQSLGYKSVLNGGVVFKNSKNKINNISGRSVLGGNGSIDVGDIEINLQIPLKEIVNDITEYNAIGFEESKLVISGGFKNLKLVQNHEISVSSGLDSLDFHIKGEIVAETKLEGNFSALFGYRNKIWEEVEKSQASLLGQSAKLVGLDTRDKVGKFPIAGLVFSMPCIGSGFCVSESIQGSVTSAKTGGVIIWLYVDLNGEISISGSAGSRISTAFTIGAEKSEGTKLKEKNSLSGNGGTRVVEPLFVNGKAEIESNFGASVGVDFFIGGVRPVNASLSFVEQGKAVVETEGEASYGITSYGDSWHWVGSRTCITAQNGYGLIFSLNASFGYEIDTLLGDLEGDFQYFGQWPSDEEMIVPGIHGLYGTWKTQIGSSFCFPELDSPENLNVIPNVATQSAGFTWDKINDVNYTLYIGDVSGFSKEEALITKEVTSLENLTVSGLALDKQYYAILRASKLGIESSPSNEVSFLLASSVDNEAPVITLKGDNPYNIIINTRFVDPGATVTDNIDNNLTIATTGSVNTNITGSYTITYKATDSSGNSATKTRTVNVIAGADTIPPVITLNGDNPMLVVKGEAFTDPGAIAIDNKDGTVSVATSGSVNTSIVGEYTVTYTSTDSDNNTSTKTRKVNVLEPTVVISPPQNLQAIAGDQKVSLVWDAVEGADSYTVYWNDVSGISTSNYLGKNVVLTTNIEVTGLTNEQPYFFAVKAFSEAKDSEFSDEIVVTPLYLGLNSKWEKESSFFGRRFHNSIVYKDKVWVFGGDIPFGSGLVTNNVWSSHDGINWEQESDAPWDGRIWEITSTVVFKNKIWVIGGESWNRNQFYGKEIWSFDGANWIRELDAPWVSVKAAHNIIEFNDKLWAIPSSTQWNGSTTLHIKDIWSTSDGSNWELEGEVPWSIRAGNIAIKFKEKIWSFGGAIGNSVYYNDVWSSVDGKNWAQELDAPWSGRRGHSATIFNDKLWIIGGYNKGNNGPNYFNDVWSSVDGIIWKQEAEPTESWLSTFNIHTHTSFSFNNKLWVIANDVWSLSNTSTPDIPDEIKIIDGQLDIESEMTQELAASGKNTITNWVAVKDPTNGIKYNGEDITSFSGDMTLSSTALSRGAGSDGTDGNKLRTGFNMSLYDKNDSNKLLTIFLRVEQGKGFLSGLQFNSIFAEYFDSSQNLIREFPLDNTDGGIGPAKDSCIVSELSAPGLNFSISRNQSVTTDTITVSCGNKSGYFDLGVISNSLGSEGISFIPSDYIVGRAAVRTKMSNATVGSIIKAKFDNIKLNGELVDDFSSSQLNTTLWNYVQRYTQ